MRQSVQLRASSIKNLLVNKAVNRVNTTENIGVNSLETKLNFTSCDSSPEIRRE